MDEADNKILEMRNHWEMNIPGLDGEFTHWWLEGDGGLLLITDDLSELIDKIQEYYCKSLKLTIFPAFHNEHGDCIKEDKRKFGIADYQADRINNSYGY